MIRPNSRKDTIEVSRVAWLKEWIDLLTDEQLTTEERKIHPFITTVNRRV